MKQYRILQIIATLILFCLVQVNAQLEPKSNPSQNSLDEPYNIFLNNAIQEAKSQVYNSFSTMIYGEVDNQAIEKFIRPFTIFNQEIIYPQEVVFLSGSLSKRFVFDAILDSVLKRSGKKLPKLSLQELERVLPERIEATGLGAFRQNPSHLGVQYVKVISMFKEKAYLRLSRSLATIVYRVFPRLESIFEKQNIEIEEFFKKAFLRASSYHFTKPGNGEISLFVRASNRDWFYSLKGLFCEYEIDVSLEEIDLLKKYFLFSTDENIFTCFLPDEEISLSLPKKILQEDVDEKSNSPKYSLDITHCIFGSRAVDVSGKILAVSNELNLVMLSVGCDNGVRERDNFFVYRGQFYIGSVVVEQVFDDKSSARIRSYGTSEPPVLLEGDEVSIKPR